MTEEAETAGGRIEISVRDARADDLDLIDWYANQEGMDAIPGTEGVRVAVGEEDVAVGFLRIVFDKEGVAYVNPVVVYNQWRGFGVGRTLMEDALRRFKTLRLVSRGNSFGFYKALGFVEIGWEDIKAELEDDCENCPDRAACDPHPMEMSI